MFILVMILLNPVSGFSSIQKLETFKSLKDCEEVREQVEYNLKAAYGEDKSYKLECWTKV